jgi:GDP-L-fucose synthase
VGSGTDLTIKALAELVADAVGYEGETHWDATKPDGTPQKLLDVSYLARLGWTAQIGLGEGIANTVEWYRNTGKEVRL